MPSAAPAWAPSTTSSRAQSLPCSVTTISAKPLTDRGSEPSYFSTRVGLAVRAHPVRLLRLAALRAEVQARRFEPVRGPALVAPRLRLLFLGDGHERASIARDYRSTCRVAPKRSSRRRSCVTRTIVPG